MHRYIIAVLFFATILTTRIFSQVPAHLADSYHDLVKMVNSDEFRAAILQGKILIAQEPGFVKAYEQTAKAFAKGEFIDQGLCFFDSLRVQNPNNPHALFGIGLLELQQDSASAAHETFRACINMEATHPEPFFYLVESFDFVDSITTLYDFLLSVQEKDSANAAVYYGLGCVYAQNEEYEKAISTFETSLALDSAIVAAYYMKGLIFQKQKKLQDALNVWLIGKQKAIALHDIYYAGKLSGTVGTAYHNLGVYKKAIPFQEKALEYARSINDRVQEENHLSNMASSYKELGNPDLAIQQFDYAITIAKDIGDSTFLETLYANKAGALVDKSEHEEAIILGEKSLCMAQNRGDSMAVSSAAWNLGSAYANIAKFQKGLYFYSRALRIRKKANDMQAVCLIMGNMANVYRDMGKTSAAIDTMRSAVRIAAENDLKRAELRAIGGLGYALTGLGVYDESIQCLKRALVLSDSLGEVTARGTYLGNIGVIYKKWGDFKNALEYLNKALEHDLRIKEMRGVVRHYVNMANIFEIKGDYIKALEHNSRALALSDSIGTRHYTSVVLGNRAVLFDKLGDYDDALSFYEKALKLVREISAKTFEPSILTNMGSTYEHMGQDSLALLKFKEAVDLAVHVKNIEDQIDALNNISDVHLKLGNYGKADEVNSRAMSLAKDSKIKMQEGWLNITRGDILMQKGNMVEADLSFNSALDISRQLESFELENAALGKIAQIKIQQNQFDSAIALYDNVINNIESVRGKLEKQSHKTTFMESNIQVYEAIITLLIKLERYEKAYNYLQRFRLRSFLEILSPDRIDYTKGIAPELYDELKYSELNLRIMYDKIGEENRNFPKNEERIAALSDSLELLQLAHQSIWNKVRARHPQYAQTYGATQPITMQQLRDTIAEDDIIVEYFICPEMVAAWIITKETIHCHMLSESGEKVMNQVLELRMPFKQAKTGEIHNMADISYDLKIAHTLYQDIFQPFEHLLAKRKHIIVIPDGILYYLPFEALVVRREEKRPNPNIIFSRYKNAVYLIEKFAISYLPSTALLRQDNQLCEELDQATLIAIFGRPDFGDFAQNDINQTIIDSSSFSNLLLKRSKGLLFRSLRGKDVDIVSRIMKPSSLYIGKEATEARLKREAQKVRHLYLSTHALVEEMRPMYSMLAMAQQPQDQEDDFLHAFEVFNLCLQAELVTLSACETGLGQLRRGEGMIGLTNAFLYAGASSLLVSLWSIDESTEELMEPFYKSMKKNRHKALALQKAKLKLLHTTKNSISFSHPYLWAPFVLVGEWK